VWDFWLKIFAPEKGLLRVFWSIPLPYQPKVCLYLRSFHLMTLCKVIESHTVGLGCLPLQARLQIRNSQALPCLMYARWDV
jgi:hypothetical protein